MILEVNFQLSLFDGAQNQDLCLLQNKLKLTL